ncbi:MAG: hypothetical protein Q9191_004972 [Dirinaria sp. TL-2023a]
MATGRGIVGKAINQLQSTLNDDDRRFFLDTTLEELWAEARTIEFEQGQRRDLRFMRRIESFLRSMESYAPVIEVFCQGDIADVLPRLDKLKAAFDESPDFHQVLGLIYSDILDFNQRAYRIFRRKGWHVWFAFDWGLFERRFKSILQRLTSHCDLVDREAAATHFLEMKRQREKRQLEEESYERNRNAQLTREVFDWLSADEDVQEGYLHQLSDHRNPGTCDWILAESQMISWMDHDDKMPILWMTNIPGGGKSFLCSMIVDNARTREDLSVLYYFCGQRLSDRNALAFLLRTLAVQLLRQNCDLAPLIHQAFLQKGSGRSSPNTKKILKEIMQTAKMTRIVLDGIDEWDRTPQSDVLKALVDLQKTISSDCKLLVSSRHEPHIQKELTHSTHIPIKGQSTEGLNKYIFSMIADLQSHFLNFPTTTWERATSILQGKADGMFLWVRLVKTELEDCSSEAEFESSLENLPNGLGEAYCRILDRLRTLSPLAKDRAFRVLYWVCVAYRSVNIDEIADGLQLRRGQIELNKKTRIQNKDRNIVDLCAPLLEKTKNGFVEAVHFSAREYLLHSQSGPFVDVAQAHFDIAFSCVANLTSALKFVPSHDGAITEAELERLVSMGSFGLQSYGHQFWAEHVVAYFQAAATEDERSRELIGTLQRFLGVLKAYNSHSDSSITLSILGKGPKSLEKLRQWPAVFSLVSAWLQFKSKLAQSGSDFESPKAQGEWQLRQDETYLSLIEHHLREYTERLLKMNSSALPPHIDECDHRAFIARFSFPCRAHYCSQTFKLLQERDNHEVSHVRSFFCLQCDFAARGFRSKEALKKHTERYHMSAVDFEVPESLSGSLGNLSVSEGHNPIPGSRSSRMAKSWSKQGRKAAQQTFHQIVDHVKRNLLDGSAAGIGSELAVAGSSSDSQGERQYKDVDGFQSLLVCMDNIRENIDEQRYDSLNDFKGDLYEQLQSSTTATSLNLQNDIQSICDTELEQVTSGFPAFATSTNSSGKSAASTLTTEPLDQSADEGSNLFAIGSEHSDGQLVLQDRRKPYWSDAENKELPKLLDRYGRDLVRIADCLKTKTLDEINRHLTHHLNSKPEHRLDQGNTSLNHDSNVADVTRPTVDINSTKTPDPVQTPGQDQSNYTSLPLTPPLGLNGNSGAPGSKTADWSTIYAAPPQHAAPAEPSSVGALPRIQGDTDHVDHFDNNLQPSEAPKKAARRPRVRAKCTVCSLDCSDEYAAKKHNARFHMSDRQVWRCVDQSLTESFISHCKQCSAGKRYASKHNAFKHLRDAHFPPTTPDQTLLRWVEQLEEPNPNYQDASGKRPFYNDKVRAVRSASERPGKRRKVGPRPVIREVPQIENKVTQYPPIRRAPRGNATAESAFEHPESDWENAQSSSNDDQEEIRLLPNVSFDHLLPMSAPFTPEDSQDGLDGFPASWIRPRHVRRLPHLEDHKKVHCQDEVEALYEILQSEPKGTKRYQNAEEGVKSNSRTLLKGLRNWRERVSQAPALPFSL